MSGVLRWEEPPGPRRMAAPRFDGYAVAEELRANPGKWGVVAESPANAGLASVISQGIRGAFQPKGSFQARHRNVDGTVTVYARYIGEES